MAKAKKLGRPKRNRANYLKNVKILKSNLEVLKKFKTLDSVE